jgi:hypothetical protein
MRYWKFWLLFAKCIFCLEYTHTYRMFKTYKTTIFNINIYMHIYNNNNNNNNKLRIQATKVLFWYVWQCTVVLFRNYFKGQSRLKIGEGEINWNKKVKSSFGGIWVLLNFVLNEIWNRTFRHPYVHLSGLIENIGIWIKVLKEKKN